METKRTCLGQLFLCKGCCCSQTQRGHPEVPVERIKEIWRREKLNRSIQLTISGCLGPGDASNVAMVLSPVSNDWLGGLAGDADYDDLIQWASDCQAAKVLLPLPEELAKNRLERFSEEAIA